jgi:hypothetical protein
MKVLQHTLLFISVLFSFQHSYSQQLVIPKKCSTPTPPAAWETEFQKLIKEHSSKQAANKVQQVTVIPVIFHVIHSGEAIGTFPNITQAEINGQIVAMNNDFAGTGFNSANYQPTAFAAWAATANVSPTSLNANGGIAIANCGIQFCLATQDTNGNILPEPGIDRIDRTAMGWSDLAGPNMDYMPFMTLLYDTIKPQSIWDVTKYLNIWVTDCDLSQLGLFGFATFPYLSNLTGMPDASYIGTPTDDGIWCYAGTINPYMHVATHEAGHWLGLRHIWGDSLCGSDYCNDTPPAVTANLGSPYYPFNVNACSGSGNGEMFMNFMDYTDNNFMFTTDQAIRMQTALANSPYRKDLGTHNLCSVQNAAVVSSFFSAPSICTGKKLTLNNASYGWPAPSSYTWSSSSGTFNPNPQAVAPTLQFSAPGIHTITLTAFNGTTSVYTNTVNVTSPALLLSSVSQTICEGAAVSFTADGVETYTWQPGAIENYVVTFTPTTSQTYTCYGIHYNGCSVNKTVEVHVEPCTGLSSNWGNDLNLQVYPNPSKDLVNLHISGNRTSAIQIQISDAIGRMISQQKTTLVVGDKIIQMDISSLDTGVYFIKVQTESGFIKTEKIIKKE